MKNYKSIRCGRGLGDALYLQGVVRHLVEQGANLHVLTDWPEVFKPLEGKVQLMPFTRNNVDIIAHYTLRKSYKSTTQFKDCCLQAGITGAVDFRLDWKPTKRHIINMIQTQAAGRPVLLVEMVREPMNRADGFAIELLPKYEVMQATLDRLKEKYFTVLVGKGQAKYEYTGIDLDLRDKTDTEDLINAAFVADAMFGYCSFFVPLAESLNKKAMFVWARKGLISSEQFIRTITPQKILHKKSSHYIVDNWDEEQITESINEFLQ